MQEIRESFVLEILIYDPSTKVSELYGKSSLVNLPLTGTRETWAEISAVHLLELLST